MPASKRVRRIDGRQRATMVGIGVNKEAKQKSISISCGKKEQSIATSGVKKKICFNVHSGVTNLSPRSLVRLNPRTMDCYNSGPKSRCSTKDQDWKQQVETKETACFSERKWIDIRKMVGTQYLLTQLS
jgi:hypothetical protein